MDDEVVGAEYDEGNRKAKTVVTKAKIAKKILKRKVNPNKKILFGEDGEVSVKNLPQMQHYL